VDRRTPGNGEGQFWFWRFRNFHSLTYLDTCPLTYSPGPTRGKPEQRLPAGTRLVTNRSAAGSSWPSRVTSAGPCWRLSSRRRRVAACWLAQPCWQWVAREPTPTATAWRQLQPSCRGTSPASDQDVAVTGPRRRQRPVAAEQPRAVLSAARQLRAAGLEAPVHNTHQSVISTPTTTFSFCFTSACQLNRLNKCDAPQHHSLCSSTAGAWPHAWPKWPRWECGRRGWPPTAVAVQS